MTISAETFSSEIRSLRSHNEIPCSELAQSIYQDTTESPIKQWKLHATDSHSIHAQRAGVRAFVGYFYQLFWFGLFKEHAAPTRKFIRLIHISFYCCFFLPFPLPLPLLLLLLLAFFLSIFCSPRNSVRRSFVIRLFCVRFVCWLQLFFFPSSDSIHEFINSQIIAKWYCCVHLRAKRSRSLPFAHAVHCLASGFLSSRWQSALDASTSMLITRFHLITQKYNADKRRHTLFALYIHLLNASECERYFTGWSLSHRRIVDSSSLLTRRERLFSQFGVHRPYAIGSLVLLIIHTNKPAQTN